MRTRCLSVVRTGMRGPLAALAGALMLATLLAAPAGAANLTVTGVEKDLSETPIGQFRWVLQEDLTYHVPLDGSGNPIGDDQTLSVGFHRSYMPVVNQGVGAASFAAQSLDPTKHYYVSVLPLQYDPTSGLGYSIGGAQIAPGQGAVEVFVNANPIPTAQIVVQVCEDTNPINNVCDPTEDPLEGFKIILEDAGGRYGASAGLQSYDVFGNPLGTDYNGFCSVSGWACTAYDDSACTGGAADVCSDFDYDNPILGSGIDTGPNGIAYVKNLAPGKYGVLVVPPAGEGWQQTSTIEGKKVIDAWVEAGEPPFFAEFGPPGPHVFIGFVQEFSELGGGSTISGQVVNLHMSRPPDYAMYAGSPLPHTGCWVGLNQGVGGVGGGVYAAPCGDEGTFEIAGVPDGPYQLVIWDDNLDVIFASKAVTVAGGNIDLGVVPVRQWFGRMEHWIYNDTNGDGVRQCVTEACDNPMLDEVGIPEQAVNLRWRDGTLYQSFATDLYGFAPFDEVFPFFSWLVAEVDFARFNATGVRMWVDDGGAVPDWTYLGGHTAAQDQTRPTDPNCLPADGCLETTTYRKEEGLSLTQGFQLFLGQTSVMEWGKLPYGPAENGGISGVVWYSTTRAEDDPRYGGAEPWEPGIPGVQVNLYAVKDPNPQGSCVGQTQVVGYNEDGSAICGVLVGTTTTDSWDDSIPTGCKWGTSEHFVTGNDQFLFDGDGDGVYAAPDCYDGLRNFNQIRPAVFDGGYAFDECWQRDNNPVGCEPLDSNHSNQSLTPLPPGRYVVEAVERQGYETVRSQDRNVDFGDEYQISGLLLPPECVGPFYTVPQFMSLNDVAGVPADKKVEASLAGQSMRDCNRKLVSLSNGSNAAAEFFHFTQTPIASQAIGFILDDSANEFDPGSPNFGEKYAPPFLPVGIRDWTGREIGRTLSDGYGRYNFLAPSTWTNSLPQPSGMSPNMLTTCMNAKYDANFEADPNHNPQFSQFCYTFQYMPGATVYLDTPVVPVSAFTAAADAFPLDCEFASGTPRIFSVTNPSNQGPYLSAPGGTLRITSLGSQVAVTNPAYQGFGVPNPGLKTILRDYGLGCSGGIPTVTIGGVAQTVSPCGVDGDGREYVDVTGVTNGGQLMVTRADNGVSTVNGVSVHIEATAPTVVNATEYWDAINQWGAIQAAIEAASPGDLITVGPGSYGEMVQMRKAVRLQGWGEGSQIDAVERTPSALQAWRDRVQDWQMNFLFDLVPGQEVGAGPLEPTLLFNEEGAGILVLAQESADWSGALIDGFTISGADSGGGIIVNGYAAGMDISNNRLLNNSGILGGGIRLGHPTLIALAGDVQYYPDAGNHDISIHHNYVGLNGGIGGAGGGIQLCTGSDGYAVTDNFVCGNFNMSHGGGVAHYGLSEGGLIADNIIVFNENFQQSPGAWSGGGLLVAGQPGFPGELSPGSGDVTVTGNLIQGNSADAGNGGGIALLQVNGADAANGDPNDDWAVVLTNNMVVNNLAGLAGGGISLQDATNVTIRHNTIARNDSTAVAGDAVAGNDVSTPQDGAGVASYAHADLAGIADDGSSYSVPAFFEDNIVWENRQFVFVSNGTTVNSNGAGVFGLCPDIAEVGVTCSGAPAPFSGTEPVFNDIAVLGTGGTLTCSNCWTTTDGGADVVRAYFTAGRAPWIAQPEQQTIATPAAIDEGGNYVRLRFGPLTLMELDSNGNPTGLPYGDYHLQGISAAIDGALTNDPALDIDGDARPQGVASDIGADEYVAPGAAMQSRGPRSQQQLLSSESAE